MTIIIEKKPIGSFEEEQKPNFSAIPGRKTRPKKKKRRNKIRRRIISIHEREEKFTCQFHNFFKQDTSIFLI